MDPNASPSPIGVGDTTPTSAPMVLIDMFFPGFSMFSGAVSKYLHIDLNLYIPLVLILGGMTFAWRYFSEYVWLQLESHFMSTVDVRHDDEVYNMLMAWVAAQKFAQGARRFVVNTNLNSRSWFVWDWNDNDDEDDNDNEQTPESKKKALSYTPTFGSHYFWYHGSVLIFRRSQNRDQGASFVSVTQREEISVSCFGRNPAVLKELLLEARAMYLKRDERKTLIYRGAIRSGSTEPTWQRCMARTARPFSTVILNEKTKTDLIEDVTDYLNPSTRRWYSNRGIPYRRGYLLYGPPGTGKSSLSLALAGFFKMRIYMVSLSSITANEENLASLFAELPRRCVVLLEDIDTAGLTHTRDDNSAGTASAPAASGDADMVPGQITTGTQNNNTTGRLSLSGLLNILDGVASQEGRVLIMTTNHLEKLDKALIRPGRVDMIVEFGRADEGQIASLFRAIFAPLEGDEDPAIALETRLLDAAAAEKKAVEDREKREKIVARIEELAAQFVKAVPAHEFSPAEIQGFLLKNKRNPDGAVAGAEAWVVETRKERKEKELKDAEDKRKADEAKAKADEEAKAKEKEEEDKKAKKAKKEKRKEEQKDKKARRRSKASKKAKKTESSDSESDSGSDASSDEEEAPKKDAPAKEAVPATTTDTAAPVVVAPADTDKSESKGKDEAKESGDEAKTGRDSGYGTPTAASAE